MHFVSIFEQKVEDIFGRVFPLPKKCRLQDLARMVCQEVQRNKWREDRRIFVPHEVRINMREEIIQKLEVSREYLQKHICNALDSMAQTKGYHVYEGFQVSIDENDVGENDMEIFLGPTKSYEHSECRDEALISHSPSEIRLGYFQLDRQTYVMGSDPEAKNYLSGKEKLLNKEVVTIGRKNASGGPYDIEIEDRRVSGRQAHCMVYQEEGVFVLVDNKSTNGTYINDKKRKKKSLEDNDRITLGETIITFLCKGISDDLTYITRK